MFTRPRAQILWVIGILGTYWALLTFVPAPGQPAPSYEQGVNIVDYLDQHVMPGKLKSGNHDANGWFSTPPVVAAVLLGALAGTWLLSARPLGRKVLGLLAAGLVLLASGWLWGLQFPIIKHIWTSSTCSTPPAGAACCWEFSESWTGCVGAAGAFRSY
jgi:predicted acyltransferase